MSVTIKQYRGGNLKWKRQEDQIYYEIHIKKEIGIYSNEFKDLKNLYIELADY